MKTKGFMKEARAFDRSKTRPYVDPDRDLFSAGLGSREKPSRAGLFIARDLPGPFSNPVGVACCGFFFRRKKWIAATVLSAVLVACKSGFCATNDLTSALQKGLFEEEANHNLDAAIQAYQAVIKQFDRDRKLA